MCWRDLGRLRVRELFLFVYVMISFSVILSRSASQNFKHSLAELVVEVSPCISCLQALASGDGEGSENKNPVSNFPQSTSTSIVTLLLRLSRGGGKLESGRRSTKTSFEEGKRSSARASLRTSCEALGFTCDTTRGCAFALLIDNSSRRCLFSLRCCSSRFSK